MDENQLFERAKSQLAKKSYYNAISLFKKLLQVNPLSAHYWVIYGHCYKFIGWYGDQESCLNEALGLEKDIYTFYLRGQCRFEQKKIVSAISDFSIAREMLQKELSVDPDVEAGIHLGMATAYRRIQNTEAAICAYKEFHGVGFHSFKSEAQNEHVHLNLKPYLHKEMTINHEGFSNSNLEELCTLGCLRSKFFDALDFYRTGFQSKGLIEIESAAGLAPENPIINYYAANLHWSHGNTHKAMGFINQAIKENSYQLYFRWLRGIFHFYMNDAENAVNDLVDVLDDDPEHPFLAEKYYLALALSYEKLGEISTARKTLGTIQNMFSYSAANFHFDRLSVMVSVADFDKT